MRKGWLSGEWVEVGGDGGEVFVWGSSFSSFLFCVLIFVRVALAKFLI